MNSRDELAKCDSEVILEGKVALVTGGTAGSGLEVAKNMARRGAKVIIASRNPTKLSEAKQHIMETTGNQDIVAKQIDLASLKSIRNFVHETVIEEPRIDILINNIGAIGLEDTLTEDNLQLMMQVNYFGSFLLTFLLFPLLKASAPSRVINVSSSALLLGVIDLENIHKVGKYSNFGYYCNAKLADVLFTVEMDKRIKGLGVSVFSLDPGLGKSDFFRNFEDGLVKTVLRAALLRFGRPLDQVARLSVFLAVQPDLEGLGGRHYRDCEEFYSSWFANDTRLTAELWDKTKMLVGITPEEDWESTSINI